MLYNTAFADAPWYINLFNYELIVAGACFFPSPQSRTAVMNVDLDMIWLKAVYRISSGERF